MKKKINACYTCKGNCYGCFYTDTCGNWNDTDPDDIPQISIETKEAFLALCEGRHNIPDAEDGFIFGNELNPLDIESLESEACEKLKGLEIEKLNLYVTGLTVALIAAINACKKLEIEVTLYHYDRVGNAYYPQKVF